MTTYQELKRMLSKQSYALSLLDDIAGELNWSQNQVLEILDVGPELENELRKGLISVATAMALDKAKSDPELMKMSRQINGVTDLENFIQRALQCH